MIQLSFMFFSFLSFLFPRLALADWTPLIDASDFDGMRSDVLTAAGGIVSLVLVIIGLAWLINAFVHR